MKKFATIGHLLTKDDIKQFPPDWIQGNQVISPEININGTKGHLTGVLLSAEEMMTRPADEVRKYILDAAINLQDNYDVEFIQLGALTTSVTSGGRWFAKQDAYHGYVTHGDSYTAAVTCQNVKKLVEHKGLNKKDLTLAIVGAYGVIGEAVSKILVPEFNHSLLIGPRKGKLTELSSVLTGDFETTQALDTVDADVVVTATNHPKALLQSEHLKKDALVVDVSQPPNVSPEVCMQRPDVVRVDGGFVSFPEEQYLPLPGVPKGKIFACIAEVIMQAMENDIGNHVGSIDLTHLRKTETWAKKHGFVLSELTNFGNGGVLNGE